MTATSSSRRAGTEVLSVDPRWDGRWEELSRRPASGLFTSPPWITALCASYGFTPEARVLVDDRGGVLGGFAWIPVDDIRGRRLSSLPFSDRADPLVVDQATWSLVSRDALLEEVPLTVRCLDGSPAAADPRMSVAGTAAWHGTPLDGSIDDIRGRLHSSVRRNIATAQRGGIRVVTSTGLDAVHEYHRLHVVLRKHKYRMLAQPLAFFEHIWNAFAPKGSVLTLLAHADDAPVAGALYLIWNGVIYYKFGASLAEHLRLRPNDAIHWAAIQCAVDRGLTLFDWGRSDLDQPGLVSFKRKWASVERGLVTLRSSDGAGCRRPESDRMLGELTHLMTDDAVPDDITARAGALLYRYFC